MMMIGLAGTMVSAFATMQQGRAAAAAAEQEAMYQRQNAQIARDQAHAEADKSKREGRRRLGSIIAAYGAAGFMQAGSPLDVFGDQEMENELEKKTILYRGETRAIGHEQKAKLADMEAKSHRSAAILGALGTGLKGLTGMMGGGAGYALA